MRHHAIAPHIRTDLPRYRPANPVALPILTVNQSPTPIHNRTFAALLTDHHPISYEGRIDIDVQRRKVGANLITYPDDMPVLYPQQSLLLVGDSFSFCLHNAGFAGGFPTIYRTGRSRDRVAFANWLASTNIITVVWQLRDMSLPLYLADQEER